MEDHGGRRWGCTADANEISSDWARWPSANVGIACGPKSGIFVIEADTFEGHGVDGLGNLQRLIDRHGGLPDTPEAVSPSGSRHLYFRFPDGVDVRNSEGRIAAGVDVRGDRGMVIAPPSVKPGMAKPYEWVRSPEDCSVAECPAWLLKLCLPKEKPANDAGPAKLRAVPSDTDEQVLSWLYSRSNNLSREDWVRLCFALKWHFGDRALDAWLSFSARYGGPITQGEAERQWETAQPDGTVNLGTAVHLLGGFERSYDRSDTYSDAYTPFEAHDPQTGELPPKEGLTFEATPFAWPDPKKIPPRRWLFGYWLLRGEITALVAPGGIGKSMLTTGIAMSLASGYDFLERRLPEKKVSVWLWNLEDDRVELERQFSACSMHYGIRPEHCGERLYVDSGLDKELCTAIEDERGFKLLEPVYEALKAELLRRQIDVLVVDPFVSSHRITENDNVMIDKVAKRWKRLATETGCSIVLVHHTKKTGGREIKAEDSRGAVALINAARSTLVLNPMTRDEAEAFGITESEEIKRYVRVDDDKPNRAPPQSAAWFRKASVDLGNSDEFGRTDNIGAIEPWTAPDPFEGIELQDLYEVQMRIDQGEYADNVQAKDWAGKVVAEVIGADVDNKADKSRIKSMLKTWKSNGAFEVDRRPTEKGREKPFLVVKNWVDPATLPALKSGVGKVGEVGCATPSEPYPTTTFYKGGGGGGGVNAAAKSEVGENGPASTNPETGEEL